MKLVLKLLNSYQQVVATAQFETTNPREGKSSSGLSAMALYHLIGGYTSEWYPSGLKSGKVVITASTPDDELDISMDIVSALAAFGCGSEVLSEVDDLDRLFQTDYSAKAKVVI